MNQGRSWLFLTVSLILILALAATGVYAGGAVGQDGYLESVQAAPSPACIGGPLKVSGSLPPGSTVDVSMSIVTRQGPSGRCYESGGLDQYGSPATVIVCEDYAPEETFHVDLGSAVTGAGGTWELNTTVPYTAVRNGSGWYPTPAGTWTITASGKGAGPYSLYSPSSITAQIADCGGSLPGTGAPLFLAALSSAALLVVMAAETVISARRR